MKEYIDWLENLLESKNSSLTLDLKGFKVPKYDFEVEGTLKISTEKRLTNES